jgi:cytochrome c5
MSGKRVVVGLVAVLFVAAGLLAACGGAPPTATPTATATPQEEQPTATATEVPREEPTEPPPAGDGEVLLEERCGTCHGLDYTTQAQKSREEWEQTVDRMIGKGAQLDEEERDILITYLAETYGP